MASSGTATEDSAPPAALIVSPVQTTGTPRCRHTPPRGRGSVGRLGCAGRVVVRGGRLVVLRIGVSLVVLEVVGVLGFVVGVGHPASFTHSGACQSPISGRRPVGEPGARAGVRERTVDDPGDGPPGPRHGWG